MMRYLEGCQLLHTFLHVKQINSDLGLDKVRVGYGIGRYRLALHVLPLVSEKFDQAAAQYAGLHSHTWNDTSALFCTSQQAVELMRLACITVCLWSVHTSCIPCHHSHH